jgi:CheY-like chemotaxis protein
MISSSDILHAKVLIVDNEEVSVLLLERLLRGAGYVSITSTTDPGEVCALHRFDTLPATQALSKASCLLS